MRLGGPIFEDASTPEAWVAAHRRAGYRAAYCPLRSDASDEVVRAYAEAAQRGDIVIAEVGAWSNPISPDENERTQAIEKCRAGLDLAERIGARCCVNIAGSRGSQWDGPHSDNLSDGTFDFIVETVRGIIDAVSPRRTFYTLETMPWVHPHSADSYVRLLTAIDRKQFAVHLDPVNLINGPERFYAAGEVIRECFRKLGPHIRSCHAKDITLSGKLTVHLDEVRPGLGGIDYRTYLTELSRLAPDVPLMLEHLPTEEEYRLAALHIRSVAQSAGVSLA